MVRASKTPGRTRDTLFFALGDRTRLPFPMLLVDLPGVGFARAAKTEQAAWEAKMAAYLSRARVVAGEGLSSRQLTRAFLLLDVRRGGMTDLDREVAEYLDAHGCPFQFVLTKADACHSKEVARVAAAVVDEAHPYGWCERRVLAVSSKTGRGLDEIRQAALRSALDADGQD